MENEIWKEIPGYEGLYEVSNYGQIRSIKRLEKCGNKTRIRKERILKQSLRYQNGKPGKFPKLEELFAKLFPGETFPAHDALQDVKALRRCVPELVEFGIIELKQKERPAVPSNSKTRELLDENEF